MTDTETETPAGSDAAARRDRTGSASSASSATEPVDVDELPGGLEAALESILMVAEAPVEVERLAAAVGRPTAEVADALERLAGEYRGETGPRPRGFELRRGAQGWRVYSSREHAEVVSRFVLEGQSSRLSQAALETLAVVAYRQPVTRGQVSAVRGVNVDGVVRTLLARGLVAEVGQDPLSGAVLFGTTAEFLDRMGWSSLDELPPLAPHLPGVEAVGDLTD
ncbi:segregation and condensation protein B [Isoptericola sp. CG 20/1183]|uniref:Segregation and condensation protein B n=1 Tax=Isoptericola halotolerans TaxID=300560 RepID=A0ABX5EAB7_9MICO|nr:MULTISPECIES: SMC-Scp complex subunit ScpB [Isoptericola]PRZ03493.1 segregation and condensation protein B [Isoptericola sp. CG 20/1183]PRZ03780.1 segregation and condensation protein B [Isoptericola halotolerans]